SWQETAEAFHTSWDRVCEAVEYVVGCLRLRDLLRYNLQTVRAHLLKGDFHQFWEYNSPIWAGMFLDFWCRQTMRS
ncbi:MAG: transposase, partial [Acidobacteriota bacterium]